MISAKVSEIPPHLRSSGFYRSLQPDTEDSITLPSLCYKNDVTIETEQDCLHFLHTMRFWCADVVPACLVEYLMDVKIDRFELLINPFVKELSFLSSIRAVRAASPELRSALAVRSGRTEILEYLRNRNLLRGDDLCEVAAEQSSPTCLKYLHEQGFSWNVWTCTAAAAAGSLDCLMYAHSHGCPWDPDTCAFSASNDHLNCLVYAHEHSCPWDEGTCANAASSGSLECLKYAHEQGCPWDADATEHAALNGHLSCLQYLYEEGCAWNKATCHAAARNGHLNCLQYAHEHDCPWDSHTCTSAAGSGHLECLIFVHEHGCEWDANTHKASLPHRECRAYLEEYGCPFSHGTGERSHSSGVAGGGSLEDFSGLYSANTKKTGSAEDFAAAWLITKDRFLASKRFIDASSNMAGVSFAITRSRCQGCYTMLSRDYFDFLVEHLSTTSNQIPYSHAQTFDIYYRRIQKVVLELKKVANDRTESDPRLKETVAILIYSSITFSRPQANVQASIREPYFEATFWSVYRYIANIIVFVATDHDRAAVEAMQLPSLEIKQLEVPLDHKNRTVALPRLSLGWVDTQLRMSSNEADAPLALHDLEGPPVGGQRRAKQVTRMMNEQIVPWSTYKYVFFSEGDQILHWRQASGFFDAVDAGQGRLVVVPHRMQTLPLLQSLPKSPVTDKAYSKAYHLNLPNSTTVVLDLHRMTGSCCDSGRYTVTECGHWWYQCPEWGLKDINPWFQFGHEGFTTPPATAHKGACTFSTEKIMCPLPRDCNSRMPQVPAKNADILGMDVCEELSIRTRLGPLVAPPLKRKKKNNTNVSSRKRSKR